MKKGKQNGSAADFIVNGSSVLFNHLAQLFGMILHHGVFPHDSALSTAILIPESGKKSISSSNNYHSIALRTAFGKLFDLVLLSSICNG